MPNTTVFLSKIFDGLDVGIKQGFLKMLEELIEKSTGLKNSVQLADSPSTPKVIVAMYDFGNLSGAKIAILGALIRAETVIFFLKYGSHVLWPKDVSVTLSSSTVRA